MFLLKMFVFFVVSLCSLLFSNLDFNNRFSSVDFINVVDSAVFKYGNSDIVGNLVIDSLGIDTFIVQGSDNEYYLDHDEYKEKNSLGSVFLDYRNNIDIDRKLLIYGHSSLELDAEFNGLENYLSFAFYNDYDNRIVSLSTKNKKMNYEVTSVFVLDDDFKHIDLSFVDDEWNSHIDWINNNSIYGNKITYDDEIVILQTCYYNPENSFLLIVLRKVEENYY